MGRFDRFCQSCGMPMDQDAKGGGTNGDGSKNSMYCSLCFEGGKFKDDFENSSEMVEFVKKVLKEKGVGRIKRWFYTSHIPKLKRWNP